LLIRGKRKQEAKRGGKLRSFLLGIIIVVLFYLAYVCSIAYVHVERRLAGGRLSLDFQLWLDINDGTLSSSNSSNANADRAANQKALGAARLKTTYWIGMRLNILMGKRMI
jgi:hypothetical protein